MIAAEMARTQLRTGGETEDPRRAAGRRRGDGAEILKEEAVRAVANSSTGANLRV